MILISNTYIILSLSTLMNQLPFLYQFKTKNSTTLQLQRQGLQFLQSFSHKKILILFTVATKINPYPFSSVFHRQTDPQSNNIHFSYPLSSITISRQIQLIEPDYILLMMNYCHKTPTSYLLLLYGYLISSIMLFHNEGELTMKSDVVELLAELQKIVEGSNYKQVEENNSRNSSYRGDESNTNTDISQDVTSITNSSIPDFYLLLHSSPPQTTKATIKSILKDFSSSSSSSTKQLQRSIDALNYLFHTRRSQHIPLPTQPQFFKATNNIRFDILTNICSKKFLGCQIYGSIIKHLACQFIILHNQGVKLINFNDLQSKFTLDLIEYQKQFGITSYVKKLSYRIRAKDLPLAREQVLMIHQVSIKETFEQFSGTVKEGLNISVDDFVSIWKDILEKCGEHLNYVLEENHKASLSLNQSLINDILDVEVISKDDTSSQHLLEPDHSQNIITLFDIYLSKSVGQQSKQSFTQLYTPILDTLINQYQQTIRDNLKYIHQLQTKNLVLTQRNQHLEKQNDIIKQRIQQCYSEKQVISYINQSKQNDDNSREELLKKRTKYKNTISILEKQVHDLENKLSEEVLKRKAFEEDLIDLTERYEHIVIKQKSKQSKPVTIIGQLSYDLKDSIQTFDKISNRVHKMQGIYKYAKEIVVENKKLTQQIQKKDLASKQMEVEHQKLYTNIDTYNSTIGQLEWNAECYKNNIRELQGEAGGYKVSMAEMDAKIQVYGKCIKLMKGYMKTGKHDQLRNFIKVSQHDDIKVQIEELFE